MMTCLLRPRYALGNERKGYSLAYYCYMNKKIIMSAATIAALAGMVVGSMAFAAGIPETGTSTNGVTHVTKKPRNEEKRPTAKLKPKLKEVKAPKSATSTFRKEKSDVSTSTKNMGRKVKVGPHPLIKKATSTKATQ